MADDSNITITLAANTAGVQTALSEAIGSFQRMRQEMQYVSDASKVLGDSVITSNRSWLEAASSASDYQQRLTYLKETLAATQAQQQEGITRLNELTGAMSMQRQEIAYLADASQILGDTQASLNLGWLKSSDGADEYAARLSYLREQLALTREQQEALANDLNAGIGGIGGMGGAAEGGFGGILRGLADIPILGNATSMMTGMLGMQAFNAAYQGISNFFTQGLFGLNKQTEQNVYSWRYTYGMGMDPTAAMANANAISAWSQRYSMDIPFTRQSLMTAISGAAPLGLDLQGLEHYFPVFSDLAATHINPFTGQPVDLGTVVQAVRGAEMGYSRMLKYDLNITPEDLVKYGLAGQGSGMGFKITDMTTLLPALEAYSKANGWTNMVTGADGQQVDRGAAYNTAHSTFWGEWSSFLDRVQNLELSTGGGLFGGMKDALEGISGWMDNHQGSLRKLADIIGGDVAGGFKTALSAVEGLGAGLHASGFDTQLLSGLQGLEAWFADPKHQQEVKDVAAAVGGGLGGMGHIIGTVAGDVTKIVNTYQGSGVSQWLNANIMPGLDLFYSRWGAAWSGLLSSGTAFWTDLFGGDFGGAAQDLSHNLQDLSSVITFGLIPAYKNQNQNSGVDSNSASSGAVSVDSHGNPIGKPTINGPANGNSTGDNANPYSGPLSARSQWDLSEILGQLRKDYTLSNGGPLDDVTMAGLHGYITQLLQDIGQNGSPFGQTNDPRLLALQQEIMNDINYINNNPNNQGGDAKAYADLQAALQQLEQQPLKNGKPGSGGVTGNGNGQPGQTHTTTQGGNIFGMIVQQTQGIVAGLLGQANANAGPAADATHNANALVQTLQQGLGGKNAQQMGSDYVQNLSNGMQQKLPVISTASQGIGTNIAQQIMQGAMHALGVSGGAGGGGGISGIGPGSTLGDLVKWTVAEALQSQSGGVWSDGHTPGGFSHFGTYGFN